LFPESLSPAWEQGYSNSWWPILESWAWHKGLCRRPISHLAFAQTELVHIYPRPFSEQFGLGQVQNQPIVSHPDRGYQCVPVGQKLCSSQYNLRTTEVQMRLIRGRTELVNVDWKLKKFQNTTSRDSWSASTWLG